MRPGVQYNQTYAIAVAWESIRILISKALQNNWKKMHLNCMLNFTQAPVERDCYTNTPKFIELHSDTKWVLNSKNNIYGKCQPGRV